MHDLNRRAMLKLLGAAPAAAGFVWTEAEAQQAHHQVRTARQAQTAGRAAAFKPKFFTAHEYATVRVLVDLIIPKDARSGSATDAGVPEFMDFMMIDQPARQTAMRGGLAWIDRECLRRHDKTFLACAAAERTALLDDIAWPLKAKPALSHGVAFFNSFRDLTASGFWTTKMGMDDLQYMGNTFVAEWKGCPDEAVKKLGLATTE
jgi:gluconate 2-dehydrogenase gamma chain